MKVVHIAEAFESGVAEYLRTLTNNTPEIEHVIIYGRHHVYKKIHKLFASNISFVAWPVITTQISPLKDIQALQHLIKILKQQKPFDVIHLHSAKAGVLGRIANAIIKCKKIIYTPHGASFLRKDVSWFSRLIFLIIEKAVNIFPVKIVGVSKSEAEAYKKIGINADYINNGISFNEQSKKEFNKDVFSVVTTGRIMRQKNPRLFNKIALAFKNASIQFIWIGDGEEHKLLTSSNIKITNWIDHKQVEQYLRDADLYLSTSLWEGLSYAVLEAMSMQLPLLLSNCPGNKDLVENGVNGFLYDHPQQAVKFINQYLNNPELLSKHSLASLNMLKTNFNIEQMVQGYIRLYNSI